MAPRVLTRWLELLYVPRCVACGEVIDRGAFCAPCAESLYPLGPSCNRCGVPFDGARSGPCARCRRAPPPYDRLVAPFRYGGELAAALVQLKFADRPDIARALGPVVAGAFRDAAADADLAIAVPLHWTRRFRRGFNQAALLLAEIRAAAGSAIAIDPVALARVARTPPQVGHDARRRSSNVASAFNVRPRHRARVAGRRIVIVDDVVTTGATIAAASRALLDAGAARVTAFAVARAEL